MTSQVAIDIACDMLFCREGELDLELVRRIESVHELVTRVKPGSNLCGTQVIATIVEDYLREHPNSDLHKTAELKHSKWS